MPLATTLVREPGEGLRERYLQSVRRVLPAAAVISLREWRVGESAIRPGPEPRLVSVDVPTADPRIVSALDAVPHANRAFDEWDLQVLKIAGRLAGVLALLQQRNQKRKFLPKIQRPILTLCMEM